MVRLEFFLPPRSRRSSAGRRFEPAEDVLISAPTGSGKTLAAFTLCFDELVRRAAEGTLPDQILVVYVSPLKALTNDVRKNLEKPLGALTAARVERRACRWRRFARPCAPAIRRAAQRQSMLRKPPHVLVTTPESLYILLTAEKSRALFAQRRNGHRRRDPRDGGATSAARIWR